MGLWLSIIIIRRNMVSKTIYNNSKAVDQLTLDGQYIKTFKSVKAASEACGLSSGAISNAIRKETASGGFRWQHHK